MDNYEGRTSESWDLVCGCFTLFFPYCVILCTYQRNYIPCVNINYLLVYDPIIDDPWPILSTRSECMLVILVSMASAVLATLSNKQLQYPVFSKWKNSMVVGGGCIWWLPGQLWAPRYWYWYKLELLKIELYFVILNYIL